MELGIWHPCTKMNTKRMSSIPVLGELRLQVLVFGAEELDEVCGLIDPRVAAQKLVAVFLQELQAHKRFCWALPPASPRRPLV